MCFHYTKLTRIPLTRTCLVILVCREACGQSAGRELGGGLSAASVDRASVHAPQDPSSRHVLPWSVPRWCCQAERRGERKANKSDKRREGNVRQREARTRLFPQKEIGGRTRKRMRLSSSDAALPSQQPRSWLLVQGKEHKFLWKLSFKHFFLNLISPRFSASLPTCYSSFLNIIIPDWDCQALSCGEAPRWWSRCTSHMPPGCRCFQDPPKAPPLCQKISEHLVSVHVVF